MNRDEYEQGIDDVLQEVWAARRQLTPDKLLTTLSTIRDRLTGDASAIEDVIELTQVDNGWVWEEMGVRVGGATRIYGEDGYGLG